MLKILCIIFSIVMTVIVYMVVLFSQREKYKHLAKYLIILMFCINATITIQDPFRHSSWFVIALCFLALYFNNKKIESAVKVAIPFVVLTMITIGLYLIALI